MKFAGTIVGEVAKDFGIPCSFLHALGGPGLRTTIYFEEAMPLDVAGWGRSFKIKVPVRLNPRSLLCAIRGRNNNRVSVVFPLQGLLIFPRENVEAVGLGIIRNTNADVVAEQSVAHMVGA